MSADHKAPTSAVLGRAIDALVKTGAKFGDALVKAVIFLAVSVHKEVYTDDNDNVLSAKSLIARRVPEGIQNASRGTIERYVVGCVDFIRCEHGFTQTELETGIPARAFSVCRALLSPEGSDKVLSRKQILGHLRNKSIQSKEVQEALGRVVKTPDTPDTPDVVVAPVSATVQLENAVSATRTESDTDAGIDNKVVVGQIKALYQTLDKAHRKTVCEHFANIIATIVKAKASAKATPRKRSKTATRKTATRK